jgi:hypothetical protein
MHQRLASILLSPTALDEIIPSHGSGVVGSKRRNPFAECGVRVSLLVSDEDLERADDLSERDALVGLPVLSCLYIVDKDDEVLVLALVVDHGLLCSASGHDCC